MSIWVDKSVKLATEANYLDRLCLVYPMVPETSRDLAIGKWERVEESFVARNDRELIKALLALQLFPLKDSYVPFFRKNKAAIEKNPATVSRIAKRLYDMGLQEIYERATQPKETNRQMGPMFRRWLQTGALGIAPISSEVEFSKSSQDSFLDLGDAALKVFAETELGYDIDKGLDFVGKIKGKYVIGEAKFLTDLGGHQDRQLDDALNLARLETGTAITVAILDGVLYLPNGGSMYRKIREAEESNIVSSLLLREFLESI